MLWLCVRDTSEVVYPSTSTAVSRETSFLSPAVGPSGVASLGPSPYSSPALRPTPHQLSDTGLAGSTKRSVFSNFSAVCGIYPACLLDFINETYC